MNKNDIIHSLRNFKEAHGDKYIIVKIGIYGSASRDTMSEQSDIDIMVEMGNPDLFNIIGIKQNLEEQCHRPVDIVRYREKMNRFLKRRIEKEAVYV